MSLPVWLRAVLLRGLSVLLILGVAGGVLYLGWEASRTQQALRRTQQEREALASAQQALSERLKSAELEVQQAGTVSTERQVELEQSLQAVQQDRENLLAQLKKLMAERNDIRSAEEHSRQIEAERDLLEQLVKQTAEENRSLRSDLPLLQSRLEDLETTNEQLAQERAALAQELSLARDQSEASRLRSELDAHRQEQKELNRMLRAMQKELQEFRKQEAKARSQLVKVQDEHQRAVKENRTLRDRVEKMPDNIAHMAKQQQQLTRETADMHYNLGVLFAKNGQYQRAAVEFRKVIELRPADAEAHYNLGLLYSDHMPDRNRAVAYFQRYLELEPNGHEANWVRQYIASWRAWDAQENLE